MGIVVYHSDSFNIAIEHFANVAGYIDAIVSDISQISWVPDNPLSYNVLANWGSFGVTTLIRNLEALSAASKRVSGHLATAKDFYTTIDAGVKLVSDKVNDLVFSAASILALELIQGGIIRMAALMTNPYVLLGAVAITAGIYLFNAQDKLLKHVNKELNKFLASPMFANLVRSMVSASDEMAFMGAGILGKRTLGVTGVLAASISQGNFQGISNLVARTNALLEGKSQHKVFATTEQKRPKPVSIADLINAIPVENVGQGSFVRITKYTKIDGSALFLVAVAGTSSFAFHGSDSLNMKGNLYAYAGMENDSVAAVVLAMRSAGIKDGSDVVFAGYSQGALITTLLTASKRWNVKSMVTIGNPSHGNNAKTDAPILQIEHTNDFVTSLSGREQAPLNDVSIVRRNPNEGTEPKSAIDGHMFDRYLATAKIYDASSAHRDIAQKRQILEPFLGFSAGRSVLYALKRR